MAMVHQLLKADKDLLRIKGKEGFTPFLYVLECNGDLNLIHKFQETCPECLNDVNVAGETALHIALRNNNFEVFKVLLAWLRKLPSEEMQKRILNFEDEDGNTVMHLAAASRQKPEVRFIF